MTLVATHFFALIGFKVLASFLCNLSALMGSTRGKVARLSLARCSLGGISRFGGGGSHILASFGARQLRSLIVHFRSFAISS